MKKLSLPMAAREVIAVSRKLLGNSIDESAAKMRIEMFVTACVESIDALEREMAGLREQVNRLKPRE